VRKAMLLLEQRLHEPLAVGALCGTLGARASASSSGASAATWA
jgi:hypothetical protein